MKVDLNTNTSFQGLYNSKLLKKGLKFAAENSALFGASVALAFQTTARPIAIMSTPDTDKENKKYAVAKSFASSAAGYLLMAAASLPVSRAVKNIDKNPEKFLKQATIQTLKTSEKSLTASSKYKFATQLFKLGLGFLIAVPKSALTCAFIPSFMKLFGKKNSEKNKQNNKNISFTGMYNNGVEKISKGIGKLIDTPFIQKMAEKFHNTKYEQHIISATDGLLTAAFVNRTAKSKNIEENRKKPLIYNSIISTGLSIAGGYGLSKALDNSTEKFIRKFSIVNKDLPDLHKYIEGIRIAKPLLILASIYYVVIPVISTFFADKLDNKNAKVV